MKDKNKSKLEKVNNKILDLKAKHIPFYRFIKRNKRKQKLAKLNNKKMKLSAKSDSFLKAYVVEYVKYTFLYSLIEIIGDELSKRRKTT